MSRVSIQEKMDALTFFGLLAVTGMLVFYALEDRNRWFTLVYSHICSGVRYGIGVWLPARRLAVRCD
jgi:hypothetical protein